MNNIELSGWIFLGTAFAGLFGSLTGLGGGVIVVPLLVLVLGIDLHYAIGASLIAVIATSSVASLSYQRQGYTNSRICLLLVTATSIGAIAGAFIGIIMPKPLLFALFSCILIYSVLAAYLPHRDQGTSHQSSQLAKKLHLSSTYPTPQGEKPYHVKGVVGAYLMMLLAGVLSGMLGIGSGALKVLAMDRMMGLPFRVSTTTSNLMIGMTAAASGGIYLNLGYIDPGLVMPVVLGITCGSFTGAHLFHKLEIRSLRLIFHVLVLGLAAQMIYEGISG